MLVIIKIISPVVKNKTVIRNILLRVYLLTGKVTRCSRYINVGRINVSKWRTVTGTGLFLAADGRCERDVVHTMNEGYKHGER